MSIITDTVDYRDGNTQLEGVLAYDDSWAEPRPAVLIAHMWGGRVDFVSQKAIQLAELGYAGFALDIYGKGVIGKSKEENAQLMQPFIDDRKMLQQRMLKALDTATKLPPVNAEKVAAIGYCFGGLSVLDLARTGAAIKGAVSIHGLLHSPSPLQTNQINTKVLILHGDNDPLANIQSLLALQEELNVADVDWQTVIYGGAMHAFTNPLANDPEAGTVYNSTADQRAWAAMLNFLQEVLGKPCE